MRLKYFPDAELLKIFQAAYEAKTPASHLHHMVMLCEFYLGARISQILKIRGEDIFQQDGRWVVLITAAKRGNEVVRSLHIDDNPACDMTPLIELAKTKRISRIFAGLDRHYFNIVLKRYAAKAGIHRAFAHSHAFRHSAAMVIYRATQRPGAITEFLGHRSSSTAMIYLAENDGTLAQNVMDNLVLA